jgi:hypothetical protein
LWEYGVTRWKNNQFMSLLGGNNNSSNQQINVDINELNLDGEDVGNRQ